MNNHLNSGSQSNGLRRKRPITLNKHRQGGFSLFIVLMVLIVMAFMVVSTVSVMNTEMRVSTNDADRKVALSLAETALRTGEQSVLTFSSNNKGEFTVGCANGLCVPAGGVPVTGINEDVVSVANNGRKGSCNDAACLKPAWNRGVFDDATKSTEVKVANSGAAQDPRYIIEYLGANEDDGTTIYNFRVTARAWGRNANTVVTIQSYIQAEI